MVLEAKLKISHKNCKYLEISRQFPSRHFQMLSSMNKDLIVINGILDETILEEAEIVLGEKLIQVETRNENTYFLMNSGLNSSHNPHKQIDLANSMVIGPMKCYQGFEYFTVFCLDETHFSQLLKNFDNEEIKTEILHIHEDDQFGGKLFFERLPLSKILQSMTQNQITTLVDAYEQGYYEVPRKATLSEITEDLPISRQSFEKTLRRAEQKLMDHLVPILSHGAKHSDIFVPKWVDELLLKQSP